MVDPTGEPRTPRHREPSARSRGRNPSQPGNQLLRRRCRRTGRHRSNHQARRQSGRILRSQRAHQNGSRRPPRTHPLRLHQRRHQQPLLRPNRQGCGQRCLATKGQGNGRQARRASQKIRGRRHAVTHPRAAGHPNHHGQRTRSLRSPPKPPARPNRKHRIPRQVLRRNRHLLGSRRRSA